MAPNRLPNLQQRLKWALAEDRAFEDVTTGRTVDKDTRSGVRLVAKSRGILAGLRVFKEVFGLVDKRIEITADAVDGDRVRRGQTLARLDGPLGGILRGERVALNLLGHLSGVATATTQCVAQVRGTRTRILDTRKTTPLWRDLEREAVRAGGGQSHRGDLAEMILVKDNHVDACGGITGALERIYRRPRPKIPVIVEARTLAEVREAMGFPVSVVLLDNMPPSRIAKAVEIIHGRTQVEVSGGVRLEDLRPLARLGVDRISLGSLTHSAPALDFSLQVESTSPPPPKPVEPSRR